LYFFALWIRLQNISGVIEVAGRTPDEAAATYAFALYSHKGLRRVWVMQLEYWRVRDSELSMTEAGSVFRNQVNARLAPLDENAPQIPDENRYVFG